MANEFHPEFGKHVYQKDHADFQLKREKNGGKNTGAKSPTGNRICAKNDSRGSVWTWKRDKMAAVYC